MWAEVEAQEDLPRPGQDGDEPHQGPAGPTDLQVTEVSPVDLHLFARQGAQTQVGFRARAGSVTGDQVAEVIRTSGVTARLDHVVQARGAQARKLHQGLQDERQVRIDRRGTADRSQGRQSRLGEDTGDTVTMHVQLRGDGADAPAFGVVIALDLRFNLGGEGHAFSGRVGYGESDGAKSPGAPSPATDDGNDSTARAPV